MPTRVRMSDRFLLEDGTVNHPKQVNHSGHDIHPGDEEPYTGHLVLLNASKKAKEFQTLLDQTDSTTAALMMSNQDILPQNNVTFEVLLEFPIVTRCRIQDSPPWITKDVIRATSTFASKPNGTK